MDELEPVFRALADRHRRLLLDRLRERDGQTLGELDGALPGMTRFGVMKHLRVLTDAGLVATRRDGRRKLHYLNPIPIQLIGDRWISRFAQGWVTGMADLKYRLEAPPMSAPKHVFEIYVRATPEQIWQAITDSDFTKRYYFGSVIESKFTPGSPILYKQENGRLDIEGEVLEAEPPRRLVHTFAVRWDPELHDPPTRVTWEITPMGASCLVAVTHDGFPAENRIFKDTAGGWPMILSSMKSLLETGEPLSIEVPQEAATSA